MILEKSRKLSPNFTYPFTPYTRAVIVVIVLNPGPFAELTRKVFVKHYASQPFV